MRSIKICVVLLVLMTATTFSQRSFLTYYDLSRYQQASPGAFKYGLYGFDNPALLSYFNGPIDLQFMVSGKNNFQNLENWGLFYGSQFSSFGIIHQKLDSGYVTDYRYSIGFGDRLWGVGLTYGFVGNNKSYYRRSNTLTLGGLLRPLRQLSLEMTHTMALEKEESETMLGMAIRPIGTYPLAFFGDMSIFNDQNLKNASWSAGVSWEVVDGARLNGRFINSSYSNGRNLSVKSKSINLGIDLSLGTTGVSAMASIDDKNNYNYSTYSVRVGAPDRSIIPDLETGNKYLKINLSGSVKYQKYIFFDNSQTLSRILFDIDRAEKDKNIKGIVVNATGISTSKELLWEIRDKLREFRESGKKVIVFIERSSIEDYHFASVADRIILDPQGMVMLEGYILSRSYYKNMLEKLGIGFEELRYFKYKSAAETFARDKMSDADREQRQKIVDDWYEFTKKEVCEGRKFTPEQFEELVKGEMAYMPTVAIEKKLVDTLGRWVDADKIVSAYDKKATFVYARGIEQTYKPFDDRWSDSKKKIAIIYAIGACDMSSGIKARSLVNDVKAAMEDSSIKAVVLRVDSPGGDAMASDYIAEVIRKNKNSKPVIVSQGAVAASGGYWLSMDGDAIVASPMTITGSIGVIGSWMYDKGASKDLGITTDYVKSGKYSDLGNAFVLPLIPIGLPTRDLNDDERAFFQKSITSMYKDFVDKVAKGRKMKNESIDSIAQGRVWSGLDGKKNGLVDELGGLWTAYQLAAKRAGLNPDKDDIDIIELPRQQSFDLSLLFGGILGLDVKSVADRYQDLKFRMDNVRVPMVVMPLDYYDLIPKY